jgi:hypothetical protein
MIASSRVSSSRVSSSRMLSSSVIPVRQYFLRTFLPGKFLFERSPPYRITRYKVSSRCALPRVMTPGMATTSACYG